MGLCELRRSAIVFLCDALFVHPVSVRVIYLRPPMTGVLLFLTLFFLRSYSIIDCVLQPPLLCIDLHICVAGDGQGGNVFWIGHDVFLSFFCVTRNRFPYYFLA